MYDTRERSISFKRTVELHVCTAIYVYFTQPSSIRVHPLRLPFLAPRAASSVGKSPFRTLHTRTPRRRREEDRLTGATGNERERRVSRRQSPAATRIKTYTFALRKPSPSRPGRTPIRQRSRFVACVVTFVARITARVGTYGRCADHARAAYLTYPYIPPRRVLFDIDPGRVSLRPVVRSRSDKIVPVPSVGGRNINIISSPERANLTRLRGNIIWRDLSSTTGFRPKYDRFYSLNSRLRIIDFNLKNSIGFCHRQMVWFH